MHARTAFQNSNTKCGVASNSHRLSEGAAHALLGLVVPSNINNNFSINSSCSNFLTNSNKHDMLISSFLTFCPLGRTA